MSENNDNVIYVRNLTEKCRAIEAFNGTIAVLKRDQPEGFREVIEYLESTTIKISEESRQWLTIRG